MWYFEKKIVQANAQISRVDINVLAQNCLVQMLTETVKIRLLALQLGMKYIIHCKSVNNERSIHAK